MAECPKCGEVAPRIGSQEIPEGIRDRFGGRESVDLYQCPDNGSFVEPGVYADGSEDRGCRDYFAIMLLTGFPVALSFYLIASRLWSPLS